MSSIFVHYEKVFTGTGTADLVFKLHWVIGEKWYYLRVCSTAIQGDYTGMDIKFYAYTKKRMHQRQGFVI